MKIIKITLLCFILSIITCGISFSASIKLDPVLKKHLFSFPIDDYTSFISDAKKFSPEVVKPLLTILSDTSAFEDLVNQAAQTHTLSTVEEDNIKHIRSRILQNILYTIGYVAKDTSTIKQLGDLVIHRIEPAKDYEDLSAMLIGISTLGLIKKTEVYNELLRIADCVDKMPDKKTDYYGDMRTDLEWHITNTVISRGKETEYIQLKQHLTHLNAEHWNRLEATFAKKTSSINK